MRQPQNAKRGRGRGRRGNGGGQPHVPNRNTSYESNGPDVKLRGNAQQLYEKYTALAHDAASAGERISAEAYSQYADHYFRLHQAAVGAADARRQSDNAQDQSNQPKGRSQQKSSEQIDADGPQPEVEAEAVDADDDANDQATTGEVVNLSPAELAEAVQQEQDSASA